LSDIAYLVNSKAAHGGSVQPASQSEYALAFDNKHLFFDHFTYIRNSCTTVEKGIGNAGKAGFKHAVDFSNDFRKFIDRGNVLDLAVGIIMGSAFTAIVNSL